MPSADPSAEKRETIAAIATAPGRSGIGVIRISGPRVPAIAKALVGELPEPRAATLQSFRDSRGEILDRFHRARLGRELVLVSVGAATRVDDRSVRLPLVLGDGQGETSTLVLTLRLDVLVDEDAG